LHIIARLLLPLAAFAASFAVALPGPVVISSYVTGLSSPVEITNAHDGSKRLFVVEQGGKIRIIRNGALVATPFLDIGARIVSGGEQGLLGLAFHPNYAQNGFFYVYYNRAPAVANGGTEIAIVRFSRSGSADLADPNSGVVLLTFMHPQQANHNGGKIAFGPDGYLYIGTGDGGGGGDPFAASQNLMDMRGKLMRIDVNSGNPYGIPPTNPYVGNASALPEIFARGLRNPFRFNFDRETGDLFIGDVGQNAWEEVDFVPAGSNGPFNFGWSVFEGTHCFNPSTNCALAGQTLPIIEYGHDANGGFAIIGGTRYRGHKVLELYGYYIYGDNVSGHVWAASPNGGGVWTTTLVGAISGVSAFGEDEEGELYAVSVGTGVALRFLPMDTDGDGMSDAFEMQYFGTTTAGNAALDGDGDGLTNAMEYAERRNPLVKDNDVFGNARLFAMQQYRDFLGREGDTLGVDGWTKSVSTGAMTRSQVIDAFLSSPEFDGFVAPVVRLYFGVFLRVPDYAGLVGNAALVRNATITLTQLADYFAASPEFQQTYGSLNNNQYVSLLYNNVLQRAPDSAGLAGWTALLDGGTYSRGQVMLGFTESTEFRANVANEVFVTMMYAGLLRRTPESTGFNAWVMGLDNATYTRSQVIDGFFLSVEYHARFMP
jgi:glucose/arabinose dehydrogenase